MAEKKKGKKKPKKESGVFIEEVPSGARPIEGVGTAVAAFVGLVPANLFRLATTTAVVVAAVAVIRRRMSG